MLEISLLRATLKLLWLLCGGIPGIQVAQYLLKYIEFKGQFVFCFQELFVQQISRFKENIIVYISGYVVKMVRKKIRCVICAKALTCSRSEAENSPAFALLNRKRWGQLTDSSFDVIAICIETEKLFVSLEKQGKLTTLKMISSKITCSVLKHLFQKSD